MEKKINEYIEGMPTWGVSSIMRGYTLATVNKDCVGKNACLQGDSGAIKFKEIKENIRYEYGCLMLTFKIEKWDLLTTLIDDEDVYDKEGFGIEYEPHVTVLFGFDDSFDKIDELVRITSRFRTPISVNVIGMGSFKNEEFDVLKFDIDSPELHLLNGLCKNYKYTNSYPDYKPHLTISYLKPGLSDKYTLNSDKLYKLESCCFKYSNSSGYKEWSIGGVVDDLKGGLGDSVCVNDFSYDQILKGIDVEKEHTEDISKALEIVLDHLVEDSSYYDKLTL